MTNINTCIPSMEILHAYDQNHIIAKCSIGAILKQIPTIHNWKFNRPPDYIRCQEIAKYIVGKRPCLDWLFYMIYDDKNGCLYLLDGIHRFTAFKIIHTENAKPDDLITPNYFAGDLSWFYTQNVLISLRTNTSEGEEIDLFRQINLSNPVPNLYIQNTDYEKKCLIEEVVKLWTDKFRTHFSATPRPNVPNINRDRFIELLDFICEKYDINRSKNSHKLEELLYTTNHRIRTNLPKNLSQKSLEKCTSSGCFLVLVKPDILQEMFV